MSYASEQAILNQQWNAAHLAELVELERKRPFMLLRPRMFPDGNQWCALYGDDIQAGVCGFGDTPEKAAHAFDLEWLNAKLPNAEITGRTLAQNEADGA